MSHPQSIEQETYHSGTELSLSVKTFFLLFYIKMLSPPLTPSVNDGLV